MPVEQLFDTDGTRLLFTDQIAELTGLKWETIRQYNAIRRRRRKPHQKTDANLLPPPVKKVKRAYTKSDGKPVAVWTPVWREDQIRAWMQRRAA